MLEQHSRAFMDIDKDVRFTATMSTPAYIRLPGSTIACQTVHKEKLRTETMLLTRTKENILTILRDDTIRQMAYVRCKGTNPVRRPTQ